MHTELRIVPPLIDVPRFGKYEVLSRIGTGGMAEIYKCQLSGIGDFEKVVVVKRMLPELLEEPELVRMFLDEARIAARLSHPNIVQIYEIEQLGDTPYIVMEYARGPTLSKLIHEAWKQHKPCARIVAKVLCEIAGALAHAHAATDHEGRSLEVVHRDVTPHNIVVSTDGVAKLLDFGVARAAGRLAHTNAGGIKGKFRYMAPEQLRGDNFPIDGRVDVFSAGVCLYMAATGHHAYPAHDEVAVLRAATAGVFLRPSEVNPDVDPELERIILWAMNPLLEERCPSALALEQALDSYISIGPERITNHDVAHYLRYLFGDHGAGEPSDWRSQNDESNSSRRSFVRPSDHDIIEKAVDAVAAEVAQGPILDLEGELSGSTPGGSSPGLHLASPQPADLLAEGPEAPRVEVGASAVPAMRSAHFGLTPVPSVASGRTPLPRARAASEGFSRRTPIPGPPPWLGSSVPLAASGASRSVTPVPDGSSGQPHGPGSSVPLAATTRERTPVPGATTSQSHSASASAPETSGPASSPLSGAITGLSQGASASAPEASGPATPPLPGAFTGPSHAPGSSVPLAATGAARGNTPVPDSLTGQPHAPGASVPLAAIGATRGATPVPGSLSGQPHLPGASVPLAAIGATRGATPVPGSLSGQPHLTGASVPLAAGGAARGKTPVPGAHTGQPRSPSASVPLAARGATRGTTPVPGALTGQPHVPGASFPVAAGAATTRDRTSVPGAGAGADHRPSLGAGTPHAPKSSVPLAGGAAATRDRTPDHRSTPVAGLPHAPGTSVPLAAGAATREMTPARGAIAVPEAMPTERLSSVAGTPHAPRRGMTPVPGATTGPTERSTPVSGTPHAPSAPFVPTAAQGFSPALGLESPHAAPATGATASPGSPSAQKATPAQRPTQAPGSRRRVVIALASVLLVSALVSALGAFLWWGREQATTVALAPPAPRAPVVAAPVPPPVERATPEPEPAPAPSPREEDREPAAVAPSVQLPDAPVEEARAPQGRLTVLSESPAKVFIDGRLAGTSPLRGREVSAETHTIQVQATGYASQQRSVLVRAGREEQLSFHLSKRLEVEAAAKTPAQPEAPVVESAQPAPAAAGPTPEHSPAPPVALAMAATTSPVEPKATPAEGPPVGVVEAKAPQEGPIASCPDGASLSGAPPPAATALWCQLPSGAKHGRYLRWFANGRRAEEGEYLNGKRNGRWTEFYEDGSARERTLWRRGVKTW